MQIHSVPLGIDNCYLLQGERSVFIDGGAPGQSGAFIKRLAELDVDPSKITIIILTHAHWDHIGSVRALVELTGAGLAVHARERAIVEQGLKSMPPGATFWGTIFGAVLRAMVPFIKIPSAHVDTEIGDDGLSLKPYGVDGKVFHTPGHSPGSVSIVLDTGEAFVGDLAMNGLPLTRRPNLPVFAEDIEVVKKSWRKLMGLGIKTVFPAHGRPFPASVMENLL